MSRASDPRITTEVYGHLASDYLRPEVDRLSFGFSPPAEQGAAEPAIVAVGAVPPPLGAQLGPSRHQEAERPEPHGESPGDSGHFLSEEYGT